MVNEPTEEFTVESKPKVEIIKGKTKQNTSICLSMFKWVVTFLIFCTILVSLVVSKLSLISLGQRLNHPNISTNSTLTSSSLDGAVTSYDADVAYTMIILFMMIPHLISFIRAFCKSAFSSIELWPGRTSLVLVSSLILDVVYVLVSIQHSIIVFKGFLNKPY